VPQIIGECLEVLRLVRAQTYLEGLAQVVVAPLELAHSPQGLMAVMVFLAVVAVILKALLEPLVVWVVVDLLAAVAEQDLLTAAQVSFVAAAKAETE
jgi:hypothetical protein